MSLINKISLVIILTFCKLLAFADIDVHKYELHISYPIIQGVEGKFTVKALDNEKEVLKINKVKRAKFNNRIFALDFQDGVADFRTVINTKNDYSLEIDGKETISRINPIPLYLSIIPPLIAIVFALLFKEVFTALLLGIFSGTFMMLLYQGLNVFKAFFSGFFVILDNYVIRALSKETHISIIVFSMLIGGTVHLISRNGGMQGIIRFLSKYANSSKSGQVATWFMGLLIFFDDYANTLVVGNTMRPVTDRLKVSREKLAYIVDSTAAPIASVAFITTWIGAQLSYIQSSIDNLSLETNAYSVFFSSLQFSFYPVLAIIFVFILAVNRREFGPMYKAELMARQKSGTNNSPDSIKDCDITHTYETLNTDKLDKAKAYNAIIPICIIVFGAIAGLIYTGWDSTVWDDDSMGFFRKLSAIIGGSDSYKALIWSSFGGLMSAIILSITQKILSLQKCIDSMISGFKTMLSAILILTLAWTLAELIKDLNTAVFITNSIQATEISPVFIPVITFLISAVVAFSTGSSWGTMAIMYPLILPATWYLGIESGMTDAETLKFFAHVVSTVLAGSVLGDHCSPISDTTILSSLASSCNHIEHVRTQLPYAVSVGIVAMAFGTIPAALGVNYFISLFAGIGVLLLIVYVFGKKLPKDL